MEEFDSTIKIGFFGEYLTLSEAMLNIPPTSTRVLFLITSDLVQDVDLNIPDNNQLRYLKITTNNHSNQYIDFKGCSFFANGVKLEISSPITLMNCLLFGGHKAENGEHTLADTSQIIIRGKADYVYGGGFAIGEGSLAYVKETSVEITGEAAYVFGGGYAVNHGQVNCDQVNVIVDDKGIVTKEVNGGNSLIGPECNSKITEINLLLAGKINGNVYLGGYAAFNSSICVE